MDGHLIYIARRCSRYFCLMFLGFSLLVPFSVAAQSTEKPVAFALIGDMPYTSKQRGEFVKMMKEVDAANLAFVLHAGDFWFDGIAWKSREQGLPPCSDEVMEDRLKLAQASRHPYIITPGDNDWTDCHRSKPRGYDPLERLAKFRKFFYSDDVSLGLRTIKVTRQSNNPEYKKYRENMRWTYNGVLFVTLHMTGSNNNAGRTEEMDKEFEDRNAANMVWLEEAFALAKKNGNKAIFILSQANPFFENNWSGHRKGNYLLKGLGVKAPKERKETGFDEFLEVLEENVLEFGKPVVYAHGDTHIFRIDKPLIRTPNGKRIIENFTRVETFGYPNTHWIRVTIDADYSGVFRLQQEIVEANRLK